MDELGTDQRLLQLYDNTRQLSSTLIEPLSEEDCQLQSMPDASPSKWHLAHTTWFFETFILKKQLTDYREVNPVYQRLFNSYYNAVGAQFSRPDRGVLSRPSLQAIKDYRHSIDEHMRALIANSEINEALRFIIELGIHHEQQHQELLLMDIKHAFSRNPLFPVYSESEVQPARSSPQYAAQPWKHYEPGLTTIGHPGDTFSFDNEKPQHQVFVAPFRIAGQQVTNAEFAEFIADGGYSNPLLWHADGWTHLQNSNCSQPMYWMKKDEQWHEFTLHGLLPLNMQAPVCHVSFFEASAYASWCGKRLPTEFEWEVAANDNVTSDSVVNVNSHAEPQFLNLNQLHPSVKSSQSLLGGSWEWTASSYSAYPGFKPFPGEAGEYNGKFMVGQYVLRGGSCLTPNGHARSTYRNFFYPHHSWQMSGIRLAEDLQ